MFSRVSILHKKTSPPLQMQPPELFFERSGSWKFRKIHKKTPVLESYFQKKTSNTWVSGGKKCVRFSENLMCFVFL